MTSTQWLLTKMTKMKYFIGNDLLTAFEQAEEMNKQEIIKAFEFGVSEGVLYDRTESNYKDCREQAEHYYNETYQSLKQPK